MRYRWAILAAVTLGMATNISALFLNTLPVFLRAIVADTGWSRTQVIAGISMCTGVSILISPVIGRLADRWGPRAVLLATCVPFGLSVMAMRFIGSSYLGYVGLCVLIGGFGYCASPVVYLSFMPRWFDRQLGLSLGVAAAGVGLGQALSPLVANSLLRSVGWREGYVVLGLLTTTVTLGCAALVLRDGPGRAGRGDRQPVPATGMTVGAALRTSTFWRLAASCVLVTTAVTGCALNMVPMLTDRGMTPDVAAHLAAMTGLSLMVGRLLTGMVLDHLNPTLVARLVFAAPVLAILLLFVDTSPASAAVSVVLLGVALGADSDIMGYMVRQAFGLRAYGQVFGYFWSAFSIGVVVGPPLMSAAFERTGSYNLMLGVFALCAMAAVVLVPRIGAPTAADPLPAVAREPG